MKLLTSLITVFAAIAFAAPLDQEGGGSDVVLSGSLENTTTDILSDEKSVDVILGNKKQNIGVEQGRIIYHDIYEALKSICPEDKNSCKQGIENAAKIKVMYLKRGLIDLLVYVSNSKYDDVKTRNLLIGTVASVGQASQEDKKNCYPFVWQFYWTCNMGDYVKINAGNGKAILDVHFDLPAIQGHFDCWAIEESVRRRVSDYLKEWGLERANVWCPDRDVTEDLKTNETIDT
ncbi:hypothetical protein B0J11DRAFT_501351 [Dendryphion nanum]|uniref:Uncharacterized protein n=1 Tax=Dendryphion nanum TaxID=256645 RepID=A0A9P9ELB6_9PLEO|nr:hypothetical protein B0J11DRAFT_501351 [Dendryphion nanum]